MVPLAMIDDIGHVIDAVLDLVARRTGRLRGVQVTIPAEYDEHQVQRSISESLQSYGYEGVELTTQRNPGPMRVVAATFER